MCEWPAAAAATTAAMAAAQQIFRLNTLQVLQRCSNPPMGVKAKVRE
jgi:hypothetical protein